MTVIKITVIHSTDYDQITMGIETLRNIVIITTNIFAVQVKWQTFASCNFFTMRHPLMNLVNTTIISKIWRPIIKSEHLLVCTEMLSLHLRESILKTFQLRLVERSLVNTL
jgi:hypothetical protein